MLLRDAEDLARFVEELKSETDRGLPLVGAALIDSKLEETLFAFFCNEKSAIRLLNSTNAPLGSFSSKIEACFALGLIDEYEYKESHIVRKIRNEFAHEKHGLSFRSEKIRGLCSSLQTHLPDDADYTTEDPRFRFINAVVALVLRFYYRPLYVEKEKLQPKVWVDPDFTRWRTIKDEVPPEGIPIMVLGKKNLTQKN